LAFLFGLKNDSNGRYSGKWLEMSETAKTDNDVEPWLETVRRQVASLRYGVVEIVVHDSRVTQIEKTERVRLDRPPPKPN
jgi:hypothetical protein